MTKPRVEVEGHRELRRALKKVEGGITDLKAAHKEAAELVSAKAGELVPVRSGTLKATIRASGTQAGGVVRSGRAGVPYAGVIHFGWPKHSITPQPFLYDALDDRQNEVIEVYVERVNELIRQHGLD